MLLGQVNTWDASQVPLREFLEPCALGDHTTYFANETSVRSDYHAGTTWAPVGQTPVVRTIGARFSVTMISAVTATGSFRYNIVSGAWDAETFIDFCDKLLSDTDGRLRLFRLPSYSPKLNPAEWVWKNVKHDTVGRSATTDPDDFIAKSSPHCNDSPSYPN